VHEVDVVNNEQFDTASVELIHTVMRSLHQQIEQEKAESGKPAPEAVSKPPKPRKQARKSS
jgi:hypothetical protein